VRGAWRHARGLLLGWGRRHISRAQAGIDVCAWAIALTFATSVRWNFEFDKMDYGGLLVIIPLAALAQVISGWASGLYTRRWRFGSFEEVAGLARAATITTALVLGIDFWATPGPPRLIPLSAALAGGVVAFALMGGARYLWRLGLERQRRPDENASRLLVFGAGDGGAQVIQAMLRDPTSPYVPVALLDDDPARSNLRIMGVPVVGGRHRMVAAKEAMHAEGLLIAIPSASADLVGELTDLANDAGLSVKVLPPVAELFEGNVGIGDIRDVDAADLLGRHEVHTDVESIAGYLTGKRVLVTGAGGSIGSELCRQIYRFAPAELIMVDHDESALHSVQLSIEGRALLDSPNLVLLDIRDIERVKQVFAERRPEVVFHAAALKHLTLLEQHPEEAVKTNVWGTLSLLHVSRAHGVERFVNISTDKAADPTSVLGYSKRVAERLTAHFGAESPGVYQSVRFGNVLGSRGSVLETFRVQLEAGGPLTVTDPEVTRYFMTVEEAVQLVIQAGAIGRSGEALVLDMGEPVRIADVANRLARMWKRRVEVVYTGLRPGEKLNEVLLGDAEEGARPVHPLISHVSVPALDPELGWGIDALANRDSVREAMRDLCGLPTVSVPEQSSGA
jgi:FlaA1/EpsC-like NDP-sugar epimerase